MQVSWHVVLKVAYLQSTEYLKGTIKINCKLKFWSVVKQRRHIGLKYRRHMERIYDGFVAGAFMVQSSFSLKIWKRTPGTFSFCVQWKKQRKLEWHEGELMIFDKLVHLFIYIYLFIFRWTLCFKGLCPLSYHWGKSPH